MQIGQQSKAVQSLHNASSNCKPYGSHVHYFLGSELLLATYIRKTIQLVLGCEDDRKFGVVVKIHNDEAVGFKPIADTRKAVSGILLCFRLSGPKPIVTTHGFPEFIIYRIPALFQVKWSTLHFFFSLLQPGFAKVRKVL